MGFLKGQLKGGTGGFAHRTFDGGIRERRAGKKAKWKAFRENLEKNRYSSLCPTNARAAKKPGWEEVGKMHLRLTKKLRVEGSKIGE